MLALTGGDLNLAVVAVGWNSERFEGAISRCALLRSGYTNVFWYRGGPGGMGGGWPARNRADGAGVVICRPTQGQCRACVAAG
jgi:hypothetical protein